MHNPFLERPVVGLEAEIWEIYDRKKGVARKFAAAGDKAACLNAIEDLITFIGRFRNCDLRFYYDEEIHRIIGGLNSHRYDTSPLLKPKKKFRLAFVFSRFNDSGGAAFTHRYIAERYASPDVEISQYILVTNEKDQKQFEGRERYQYMRDRIEYEEFGFVPAGLSMVEQGQFIERWLFEREIDFAVVQPSLPTLYALASSPALISATFSADWHCFTIGPGVGDYTFLMTTDQVYKYRYDEPDFDRRIKTIMLPLPPADYIDAAEPLSKAELGVPADAIVSATTNIWKCCFGDDETLLKGVAELIRLFPNYHHLFVGTPRAWDNVEFFLAKNPDIRDNIHFIGTVPYIYRLLKAIDFYVNSYPVSGASNTETAAVGKPSIDLFSSRDLAGHGTELLRSHECEVISLDEFVRLGARYISDPAYRDDLGKYLKDKVRRDLEKNRIVNEKIYDTFITEFQRRVSGSEKLPALRLEDTLAYEKLIGLYNSYGKLHWPLDKKVAVLSHFIETYPDRPFASLKLLSLAIEARLIDVFRSTIASLSGALMSDYRIRSVMAVGFAEFGDLPAALEHARGAASLTVTNRMPAQILTRILLLSGQDDEAREVLQRMQFPNSEAPKEALVALLDSAISTDFYTY